MAIVQLAHINSTAGRESAISRPDPMPDWPRSECTIYNAHWLTKRLLRIMHGITAWSSDAVAVLHDLFVASSGNQFGRPITYHSSSFLLLMSS